MDGSSPIQYGRAITMFLGDMTFHLDDWLRSYPVRVIASESWFQTTPPCHDERHDEPPSRCRWESCLPRHLGMALGEFKPLCDVLSRG